MVAIVPLLLDLDGSVSRVTLVVGMIKVLNSVLYGTWWEEVFPKSFFKSI